MNVRNRPELRLTEPLKRIVLQLRIEGAMPRIRLGQALGITGATMTRLTQQLIALDVVEEMDAGRVANARPADGALADIGSRRGGQ